MRTHENLANDWIASSSDNRHLLIASIFHSLPGTASSPGSAAWILLAAHRLSLDSFGDYRVFHGANESYEPNSHFRVNSRFVARLVVCRDFLMGQHIRLITRPDTKRT